MTQPTTDTRAVVRAFDALTTQVQRVADALFPPVPRGYRPVGYVPEPTSSPTDDAPTTGDDGRSRASRFLDAVTHSGPGYDYPAPAADEDALRTARRDSLLVLLSRAYRGTLIPEESELLRHHVEAEIRESNTARAVAAGNVRHVQQLVPEIDRLAEEREQLRTRAGQAEDLLRVAHETSNQSEAERALAVQRAEIADAVTAEAKQLLERRTTTLRERAERAEHERDVTEADLRTANEMRAEVQRDRDQHAAVLREVMVRFHPVRDNMTGKIIGYDGPTIDLDEHGRWRSVVAPTVERLWWQTVAEVRAELEAAQATIERVRDAAHLNRQGLLSASELHAVIGPVTEHDGTNPIAPDPPACDVYQPPANTDDSGYCARCGMRDWKHPAALASSTEQPTTEA